MSKVRRLPLPPRIDAIAQLDDIEDLIAQFQERNGYAPELLSHWDPKLEFAVEIERWLSPTVRLPPIISYFYSSYLPFDKRLTRVLHETPSRGMLLTNSGTTSIATVIAYLASIGTQNLFVLTPCYFTVEAIASRFGLSVSFIAVERRHRRYSLPQVVRLPKRSALWLTLPIYGTSCYIAPTSVGLLIDSLPADSIAIVDESLAYPDRNGLSATKTISRSFRIATPHKALSVNGEKVSVVTFPPHLTDALNDWSECLAGGIGAAGMRALDFLIGASFTEAVRQSRVLARTSFTKMTGVLGNRPSVSLDQRPDGHFVMLYWPKLPMSLGRDTEVLTQLMQESGAAIMPASRSRHPEEYGFSFRVNLLRLDDAGLGALKRLADALDARL